VFFHAGTQDRVLNVGLVDDFQGTVEILVVDLKLGIQNLCLC